MSGGMKTWPKAGNPVTAPRSPYMKVAPLLTVLPASDE